MATHGELVSTHMPKKLLLENWLHEYRLLASVTLPLGGTVYQFLHFVFGQSSTKDHLCEKVVCSEAKQIVCGL